MDESALHDFRLEKKHHLLPLEGGAFTFVTNAPLFQKIHISKFKDEWKSLQGTRHILKAELVSKSVEPRVKKKLPKKKTRKSDE